jgi:UDP-glucose 4-epimerase
VIHFAALKSVEESVEKPLLYYENNVNGMVHLLEMVMEYGIRHFIFSSSCTVYGNAEELPVTEDTPIQEAESPYGLTKQVCELILKDFSKHHPDLQIISLRYFNPAGAHESGTLGENPINPPRNLVPIITEVAIGKRDSMTVFGDNYNTRDGSCIRDYIHVQDLGAAHTRSLEYLATHPEINYNVFNVGIGEGASVLEAINAFESTTGEKLNYKIGPRRHGDVEAIYSNYQKAKELMNWNPRFNMADIMSTAWKWEQFKSNSK